MSAKEKITKIVEKWYLLDPLFFSVWTLHRIEPVINIKTIRVQNGRIEFNPHFINSLTTGDLESVLSFEAMRMVLKHPYSRKKDNPEISYLASNITIQEYLKTSGLGFMSAFDYFSSHEYDREYFEFYYDKIIELKQNQSEEKKSDQGKNQKNSYPEKSPPQKKKEDSSGEKTSPHQLKETDKADENQDHRNIKLEDYSNEKLSGYENTYGWDKSDYQIHLINDKIKEIQISQSWGTITDNIKERILATLKPRVNYKTILKSFRASVLANTRTLTRMKPSRRYGFLYMGSRRDFTTRLLFAVDVSGSVSNIALCNAFSILNKFFKYGIEEISVICFDTEIKGKRLTFKKARTNIEISGRGGTDFSSVIEYIDKDRSYDGVIIFTDGYAPCPPPPRNRKTKILWLFDSERNYRSCKETLSKLGKVAYIKES